MSVSLRVLLDNMTTRLYGRTKADAHREVICIRCASPVRPDEWPTEDATEYMLSGLCPTCYGRIVEDCE